MEGMRLNMVKPYRLPKVKIPKTKSEWIWDMIGIGFYISSTIYLLIVWNQIPDQVPGHFNALGEADRWGPKWDLWLFPIMGALLLISLQIVEKFPEIYNYPKRINETNFKQFYLLGRQLINQLKIFP